MKYMSRVCSLCKISLKLRESRLRVPQLIPYFTLIVSKIRSADVGIANSF